MLHEFKDFIARGNVIDIAVGIILGAAFTAIVSSMVEDLINPIISLFIGGIDFGGLKLTLGSGPDAAAFNYGNFVNAVIKFLIISWVVFLMVKGVNRMKPKEAPVVEAPKGPSAEELLVEIRDALKARG